MVTDSSTASGASSTAAAVTICAVSQFCAVNVSEAMSTVTAPVSPLVTATATLAIGAADSRTA